MNVSFSVAYHTGSTCHATSQQHERGLSLSTDCVRCYLQLRQCEVLQREQDQGKELTAEEAKKLERVAEWTEEVSKLERQLA